MPRVSLKSLLSLFAAPALASAAVGPGDAAPLPPASLANPASAQAAAKASNDFGLRLLQVVAKQKPGTNTFVSPVSLSQALGMASGGAEKATLAQMVKTLGIPADHALVGKEQAALLLALMKPEANVTLRIANAIWSSNSYPFRPNFAQYSSTYFNARATSLDFRQPAAADTINRWVSGATEGKIPTLVTPDTIANASAVLTNAVYFRGKWQSVFEKEGTRSAPFTPENGKAFSVPLMHQTGFYPFFAGKNWSLVTLPYSTGRFGFVAVLPNQGTKLATVLGQLTQPMLADALSKAQGQRLALAVPRFKMTYEASLNAPLGALGMPRAFTDAAEFAPMFTHGTHAIGAVIHKTVLEVKEEGAEAAAATGVIMRPTAMMPVPARAFVLDRPFACFIVDGETGAIVFAGAVYHPDPVS